MIDRDPETEICRTFAESGEQIKGTDSHGAVHTVWVQISHMCDRQAVTQELPHQGIKHRCQCGGEWWS